jgi:uncharacterized protein YjbI with pentapeptide repeats
MLSEKLELHIEKYFRPYKKDQAYRENKKVLVNKFDSMLFQLKNEGLEEQEAYDLLTKKLECGDIKVDVSSLSVDENNKLNYYKKIFINDNLEDLELINVRYRLCDFKESRIENREISYSEFKQCYLRKATVNYSTIVDSMFNKSDLGQAIFTNCKITNASFYGSDLPKVSFEDCVLLNVSFDNCYFRKSSFLNSKLINVQFESCTLSKLDFTGAIMDKITYRFLEEEGVKLTGVDII